MTAIQILVLSHVAAGSVALATYWTAGLVKKGTPLHRRAGQVYLLAMLAILLSGIPLVVRAVLADQPVGAAFLGYLLLLVAQGCWTAWRAIRDRRTPQRFFSPVFWSLTAATVLAGVGMIVLGLKVGAPILAVFGGVGGLVGLSAMRARRRAATDPKWWLKEHYGAMIGNGVATHIAFFSIGLRRLLPDMDPGVLQNLAWFTPLAAAFVAGWWLDRKYGGKPVARATSRATGLAATE